MPKGIDCTQRLDKRAAAAIKAAGYDFAGRYLVPLVGSLKEKALTRGEAEAITEAGLTLLTVWETTSDRAKGGATAGTADGRRALECARAIGMPEQGMIYFAVDYDAPAGDMPAIEEYFRAARAETEDYEVGVYGPYRVIEYLAQRRVCRGYWQCVGWSGGQLSAYRNVYQAQWGKVVAGIPVDIDDCPDMARAGLWDYALEEVSEVRYNQLSEVPDWAKGTVETLVDRGFLAGSGGGEDAEGRPADLDLSMDMLRLLVIMDRAGAFSEN